MLTLKRGYLDTTLTTGMSQGCVIRVLQSVHSLLGRRKMSMTQGKNRAVAFTLAYLFCASSLSHSAFVVQTRSTEDFTWLLEYSTKSTNMVISDRRFGGFLAEVVPDVKLDLGMRHPYPLKDAVREFIGGPPENVSVQGNRYVTLSACRAHSCPEKAWLWCDIQDRVVVGILVHYMFQGKYSRKPSLLLFSRRLTAQSLPEQCKREMENWLHQQQIHVQARRFVGRSGKVEELKQ